MNSQKKAVSVERFAQRIICRHI